MLQSACPPAAKAFTVPIRAGTKALFLQVGAGTMTGGPFGGGGVPGNDTTINRASISVPAAQLGSGRAQAMSTDSMVTASPWDNFAFCTAPAATGQVYVGGFYRAPGSGGAVATLSVRTTQPHLVNGSGATMPFRQIAWTSSGNGNASPTVPSGAFTGSAQTLLSAAANSWFESCLAFRYLNTQLVPAGSFTGRAIFTLTAP